jgi:hypothetical protein
MASATWSSEHSFGSPFGWLSVPAVPSQLIRSIGKYLATMQKLQLSCQSILHHYLLLRQIDCCRAQKPTELGKTLSGAYPAKNRASGIGFSLWFAPSFGLSAGFPAGSSCKTGLNLLKIK